MNLNFSSNNVKESYYYYRFIHTRMPITATSKNLSSPLTPTYTFLIPR